MDKKNDYKARAFRLLIFSAFTIKTTKNSIHSRLSDKKINISHPALIVLHYIKHGPNTIKRISELMLISAPTLVPVIDLLEKKQLLKRTKNEKDRRENILELTKKGKSLVRTIPMIDESGAIVKSLTKLGQKKSKEFLKLYYEFINNLEDNSENSKKMQAYIKNLEKDAN